MNNIKCIGAYAGGEGGILVKVAELPFKIKNLQEQPSHPPACLETSFIADSGVACFLSRALKTPETAAGK